MKIKKSIVLLCSVFIATQVLFAQAGGDLTTANPANVFSSGEYAAYYDHNAFADDLTAANIWESMNEASAHPYIGYNFGSGGQVINWYRFYTPPAFHYTPAQWVFEGAHFQSGPYAPLHTVSADAGLSTEIWTEYYQMPGNTTPYQYYRIRVTKVNDHPDPDYVEINEIEMGLTPTAPTVTTTTATSITTTGASSGGNVTANGGASVTARGVCWSTSVNPTTTDSKTTDGAGTGTFTSTISGCVPGTEYHYRAYATNSEGTSYGADLTFTTGVTTPTVTTSTATSITTTGASSGGNVTANGGASVTARGVCWSTGVNPTTTDSKTTDGSGTGTFTSTISGCVPGTEYHYRAYATNSVGTSYGADLTFTTSAVDVTFTNGANAALDFQQVDAVSTPQTNWLCGQFRLQGAATGATFNSVVVTLGGSYDASDLQATPFQLYGSNSNDYGTASALGSAVADPGSGSDVTFSSLSDAIPSGMRYYWVTADLSASATGDDTMTGTVDAAGDLSISGATLSGSSVYGKLNAGDDASLPVELSAFSAKQFGAKALIEWTTESEESHLGFILEKTLKGVNAWETVASYLSCEALAGSGNTSEGREYAVEDENLQTGVSTLYRLLEVDKAGTVNELDVIELESEAIPEVTTLEPPYPNPFNPSTKIPYKLAREARVTIHVFDLLGRKVVSVVSDENHVTGAYYKYWNGRDESGVQVPSGVYLIRLQAGTVVKIQKAVLTR